MTRRSCVLLVSFLAAVEGSMMGRGRLLEARAAQTGAVCSSDFAWADNSKNMSPCLAAAYVLGSCVGNNWDVPALNSSFHYTFPSTANGTANPCSCSWAAYNLLGACTACQGFEQSISNWTPYIQNCGDSNLSNQYFPSSIHLTDEVTIPFWAATNPANWTDQRFDVDQAKAIQAQGHPDLSGTVAPTPKKSTPIGAIIGGVIGGLAVIALAVAIVLFMICRRKKVARQNTAAPVPGQMMDRPAHGRSVSDFSSKSAGGVGLGYARMPQSGSTIAMTQGPLSPTSLHTHNSSAHSLSYFGAPNGSVSYTSPSPPPRTITSPSPTMQHVNREDIIVPFNLQPLSPIQESPGMRKGTVGGSFPVYDSQNAPPFASGDISGTATPPRSRVNPPAYSASESPGSPSPQSDMRADGRPRHKQGSVDSGHSLETSRRGHTVNGSSVSGINEAVSQLAMGMSPDASGYGGNTIATGHSNNAYPRDHKRRPNNPDERHDIA